MSKTHPSGNTWVEHKVDTCSNLTLSFVPAIGLEFDASPSPARDFASVSEAGFRSRLRQFSLTIKTGTTLPGPALVGANGAQTRKWQMVRTGGVHEVQFGSSKSKVAP